MHLIAALPGFHPMMAFGIPSGPDLIILLVIVLVLFGAKRLPELARGLGQSVNEFKKAKEEFDKEVAKPASSESPLPPASTTATASTSETKSEQKQS